MERRREEQDRQVLKLRRKQREKAYLLIKKNKFARDTGRSGIMDSKGTIPHASVYECRRNFAITIKKGNVKI